MNTTTTRHFRTLDAMRGVAAAMVVMLHCGMFLGPLSIRHAYLAVDLFYALSGLVIAHAYATRFGRDLSTARFAVKRVARLYPLYILGTGIGILFYLATTHFGAKEGASPLWVGADALAALAMLPAPWKIEPFHWLQPFNMPAWSLVYELLVNILLALIWRWLNHVTLSLILLVSGGALFGLIWHFGTANLGSTWATVGPGLVRAVFSFFVGVAMQRLLRPGSVQSGFAIVMALAIVPLMIAGDRWGAAVDLACIFVFLPALVFIGAHVEPRGAALAGLSGVLGNTSFALYALHVPLLQVVLGLCRRFGVAPAALAPLGGVLLVAAMCVVAGFADRLYDRPVRAWFARRQAKRPGKYASAAASAPVY